MAKVLVEVPDDLINWMEWAKRELAKGGLTSAGNAPGNQATGFTSAPAGAEPTDDPWAGTDAAPAQNDPWASPTGSGTTTAAQEAPDNPPASGTLVISGQNGNRTVTFGKSGAPSCKHGQPAAFTKFSSGKTNFACALSQTKRWKEKCDFVQWA